MIDFNDTFNDDEESFDLDALAETIGKTGFEYFDGEEDDEPKELNF
jgi:hypothetical protein